MNIAAELRKVGARNLARGMRAVGLLLVFTLALAPMTPWLVQAAARLPASLNQGTCLTLTVIRSPEAGGTVEVTDVTLTPIVHDCPVGSYPYGAVLEFEALPATDYTFSSWADDLTGTDNPDTKAIVTAMTVTANFHYNGGLGAEKTYIPFVARIASILDGGFELGSAGEVWSIFSTNGDGLIYQAGSLGNGMAPHGGSWAVRLGGMDDETAAIQQTFQVPPNAHAFTYWRRIVSSDTFCAAEYDSATIWINDSEALDSFNLCTGTAEAGWVKQSVDISAYRGEQITLKFEAITDSELVSSLYLDDFQIE